MLALGFTLGALGGLDTTVREHFAGYRSHTLVLSAFPAVALTVIAALAGLPAFLVPLLTRASSSPPTRRCAGSGTEPPSETPA